jgi:hypothetical protein
MLGTPRIAAMGAVAVALVGFFAFLILRVTAPQMTRSSPTSPSRTPPPSSWSRRDDDGNHQR